MALHMVPVLASVFLVMGFTGAFVLHDNVKVINLGQDQKTGKPVYDAWHPNPLERVRATNFFSNSQASRYFSNKNPSAVTKVRADYIDNPINLTHSSIGINSGQEEFVVELLIVCDKEFGDAFQQDRVKILDHLTVYFWDVSMRYKTLPSVNLSFRITGVVVISSTSEQPFIENSRDSEGKIEYGRTLPLFSSWVHEQASNFPKFDLAIVVTNTAIVWGGGLAYMRHACSGWGSLIFNSDGSNWEPTTVTAHEIAHTLGAPHDYDDLECRGDTGYVMNGGSEDMRYFFSSCSDKAIREFVTSDQASCLRRIDEPGLNLISPGFSDILTPTAEEQCKHKFGPGTYMEEADKSSCVWLKCSNKDWWWGANWIYPAENTVCSSNGGRCFQGTCRAPDYLIQNVASGQCLKADNQFAFTVNIQMADCPRYGTPYDRFALNNWPNGITLGTPWQTVDASEHGDRCIYTGNGEGGWLWTDRCSQENPWHGWDFLDVGNGEYLLKHRVTKRCAKQEGTGIATYSNCDGNDRNMRWRIAVN